jgi:putative transposase
MSPSERKTMINRDRADLSLTRQCKLLKISRSSLYCAPVGVNDETLKLMNEIDRVFTKYPFFGSRHRVRRLMGLMGLTGLTGLQAIYRGPNTRCPAAHAKHV